MHGAANKSFEVCRTRQTPQDEDLGVETLPDPTLQRLLVRATLSLPAPILRALSGGGVVYQGAIAVDGTGNWLALNELAAEAGSEEFPYVVPNGKPLTAAQILGGHASDPFYIDIANYTDFYRLRASLTDVVPQNPRMRRYDWPSAHAPAPTVLIYRGRCDPPAMDHLFGESVLL